MNEHGELDAVLIANLADLEASTAHIEDKLTPRLYQEVNQVIKAFRKRTNWVTELISDEGDAWFAPQNWKRVEPTHDDDYALYFSLENVGSKKGEDSRFWISPLLGVGPQSCGLVLRTDYLKKNDRYDKVLPGFDQMLANVNELGFCYEPPQGLYLPVTLDIALVAQACRNDDFADALIPLANALEAARSAAEFLSPVARKLTR